MKDLQLKLTQLNDKLNELQDWLLTHYDHPDFMKIVRDRNHLLVKINATQFKINQLEHSLPIFGVEINNEISTSIKQ